MGLSTNDPAIRQLMEECERATVNGEKRALRYLRRLRTIASEKEDNALLGYAHFYYANWYYDASQYEQFKRHLKNAIRVLLRSDAYELLARSYNFFAIDAQSNDAYDVAYSYYMSALRFIDEKETPGIAGIVVHNLANFYTEIGEYRLAHSYYRRAMRMMDQNKEDPFYDRNMLIAYVNDGMNALTMGDVSVAGKAFKKAESMLAMQSEEQFIDVLLSYHIFEVRLALATGDKKRADDKIALVMKELGDDAMSFVEMEDIRDFCIALMKHEHYKEVEKTLAIIVPQVKKTGITHALRLLAGIQVEYYGRVRDEKKLMKALQEQHRLLLRQKEDKKKIYQYSMQLIDLIGKLQQEESAVRDENRYLQEQILTDTLTGLPNRYALDLEMTEAFERVFHKRGSLGVAILDIDDFKSYNDEFGHSMGDACLRMMGDILASYSKTEKIFCARYGGDEFVIIYENRSAEEIRSIAERINEAILHSRVIAHRKELPRPVTVSQGICHDVPKEKSKPWDYFSEADEALYYAKGRKKRVIPIRKLPKFGDE